MNKTINVNIGGWAFIIDEDAHLMLSNYLHQIESRLSPLERREIMEDVENRVADIFSQKLSIRAQVVSSAMVRDAMETIGRAEDFGDPQPNDAPKEEKKQDSKIGGIGFERSRSDKMIAGICGGISSVAGIDVTLIRLALILLAVASFSILFWAYLILWIVVPQEEPVNNSKDQKNERR